MTFKMSSKRHWGAFPGDPVVENLPSNAGDGGLISGQGTEIPHAVGRLNLSAASREATTCHTYRALELWSPCTPTRDAHAPQQETPMHPKRKPTHS